MQTLFRTRYAKYAAFNFRKTKGGELVVDIIVRPESSQEKLIKKEVSYTRFVKHIKTNGWLNEIRKASS
jgi:hypothetical protein